MNIEAAVGFSVEWKNGTFEKRDDYKNLPCYEFIGGEVTAIAIVENPAINEKAVITSEQNKTITGPVMIPDLKILRLNSDKDTISDPKYYIYFSGDTIRKLGSTYKGEVKYGH